MDFRLKYFYWEVIGVSAARCRSYCVPLATNLDLRACGSRYRWDIDGSFSISPSPFSRFLFSRIIYTFSIIRCFHSPEGGRRRNGRKETRTISVLLHPEEFPTEIHRFPFRFRYKGKLSCWETKVEERERERNSNIKQIFLQILFLQIRRGKKEKSFSSLFLSLSKFAFFSNFSSKSLSLYIIQARSRSLPKKEKVGRFEGIHWPRSASVIDFRSVIKPFREDSKWHCAKNSPSRRRSTTLLPSSLLPASPFPFRKLLLASVQKLYPSTLFLPSFLVPCSFFRILSRENSSLSLSVVDRHGRGYRSIIRPSVLFIPLPAIEIAASPKGALLLPSLPLFHRVHLSKEVGFRGKPVENCRPQPATLWPPFIGLVRGGLSFMQSVSATWEELCGIPLTW